jgi:C4-dicarboxylate-specific signal transduction histidine kinase
MGCRGRVIGASTIARDVTRSKLAEQSLQNSEKLAITGRMAATVAHEINNPLWAARLAASNDLVIFPTPEHSINRENQKRSILLRLPTSPALLSGVVKK